MADLYKLIVPLGIAGYTCLVLTIFAAMLGPRVKWIRSKWHMWLGIATLLFTSLHVLIVILSD